MGMEIVKVCAHVRLCRHMFAVSKFTVVALLWEAALVLDFVMVTLISNEGSFLAPLSPLIAEHS